MSRLPRSIAPRAAWLAPVLLFAACDDGCRPKPKRKPPVPTPAAACPAIRIAEPAPLVALWDDGTVALAIALELPGDHAGEDVVVTAVTLAGGVTIEPAALPLAVGAFQPRRPLTVHARFQVAADGSAREVRVVGDARIDGQACHFDAVATVAPAAPAVGPVDARPITVARFEAATASWPPPPPPVVRIRPNVEELVPLPLGPPRDLMTAVPAESRIARLPDITGDAVTPPEQGGGTHAAVFTRNNVAGNYGGTPPDPSVAATSNSGVVIISANTAVSWSKDWGATFTEVPLAGFTDPANPARTTFFPAKDRGLCCDQVLTYSRKHDLFIWVIQTWPTHITSGTSATKINGTNRLYLAWAKPAAVAADFLHAWSWIELDSALFGLGDNWMDYPDVTVSDANVYVSVDRVRGYLAKEKDPKDGKEKDVAKDGVIARIYARVSLADLAGGGAIGGAFVVLDHPGILKGHIARESPDTMYFAALSNSSKLRAYTWPDSSGSVSWFDVPMTSITFDSASTAPDGVDWNSGPVGILGAVLTRPQKLCFGGGDCDPSEQRVAWYAFPAGRNVAAGRAQPYVRVAAIDMRAARLQTEVDIWNASVAYSLPSLSGACTYDFCDLAVSLAVGGGGRYPDNAVGFLYDWLVYVTTASDATQHWDCTPDKATTKSYCSRWGDYFNVVPSQAPRTAYGHGAGFSTLGYSVRASTPGQPCATGGCTSRLQYVQFGRDGSLIPPRPPR